jgi:hypothetical protein
MKCFFGNSVNQELNGNSDTIKQLYYKSITIT